ncbi:hypothetical protein [Microlunatus flavus]|uniref:Uncharacterized protein n=1 Tax=Microlunatus flavus TaxID=1036181 RepID=A0A1H8YZ04_9ACTN|nr:hypothetical protein [Microlunatus flavus]SEP57301.1 hypothetical protein SAMN05421756_10112 [Microlunatus flavus]
MAATTFTSIVLVAFALVVLTIASYAWFGDWEPQPRRLPADEERARAEVEAFRRAIESYERDQQQG